MKNNIVGYALSITQHIPNIILPKIVKMFYLFRRKKKYFGRGTYIDPSVHLIHYSNILIGNYSIICEGAWLSVNHVNKEGFAIIIGNNCFLGRRCIISSGRSVVIKDYVAFAADCKLLGSSHVINDPFKPYLTTGTTNNWSIEIGVNCFFGSSVIINGNVTIGHGCVIGANSFIINQNIPPFSMVVGNPARIIKRYSTISNKWVDIDTFTDADDNELPSEECYLKVLSENYPKILTPIDAFGKNFGNLP